MSEPGVCRPDARRLLARASCRGLVSGAALGAVVAAVLQLLGDGVPGLLPFAVVGGVLVGAAIGPVAAAAAAGVLVIGERRACGRLRAARASAAAVVVGAAAFWSTGIGYSDTHDARMPATLAVVAVSTPLAVWNVRRLVERDRVRTAG